MVVYTHGHAQPVLRSHRWRTAENSAGYLLPHLKPGMSLLDVGCGPGTITVDLAERVAPGRVAAVDQEQSVVEEAAALDTGIEFSVGDVYDLGFADDTFDIVHAHQVLQHVPDPAAALEQMRRVCKPGGIVAVRDADYAAMVWYPANPGLDQWLEVYRMVSRDSGGDPDAGRKLLGWGQRAGFTEITPSASTWCFATVEQRRWWGGMWADRIVESRIGAAAVEAGHYQPGDLTRMARAWRRWAAEPAGWFSVLNGELLCRV